MASSVTCPNHDRRDSLSHHSYRGISTLSSLDVTSTTAISPSNDNSDSGTCYSSLHLQTTEGIVRGSHSRSVSDLNKTLGDMEGPSNSTRRQKTSKSHKSRPKPQRTRTVPSIQSVPDARDAQRSASRSTARSGHGSCRSSLHSARPAAKIPSVPGRKVPKEKRENLIALHREACQLFPNEDSHQRSRSDGRPLGSPTSTVSTAYFPQTPPDVGSPALSPVIRPQLSPSDRYLDQNYPVGSSHGRLGSRAFGSISDDEIQFTKHAPATVIDWTSPSARRREYEKIDRANRGIRGLWQRVAPKWCQFGDRRVPFYEEGKADDDGSVRRFRVDIPEEPDERDGDGRRSHHGLSKRQRLSSKINRTSKGSR